MSAVFWAVKLEGTKILKTLVTISLYVRTSTNEVRQKLAASVPQLKSLPTNSGAKKTFKRFPRPPTHMLLPHPCNHWKIILGHVHLAEITFSATIPGNTTLKSREFLLQTRTSDATRDASEALTDSSVMLCQLQ